MSFYITHEEFQNQMEAYYERTGNKMQFPEMCEYLYRKGLSHNTIAFPELNDDYENMTDEEFDRIVDSIPFCITPYLNTATSSNVREAFVIRHPRYTRDLMLP